MEGAAPVPAVEVLEKVGECPPPKTPKDADLAPVLATLHAISCHPEAFGMATPALRETLEIPESVNLGVGRRYVRVDLGREVAVAELLAAMGVKGAKVRLRQGMAPRWAVGTGDDAAQLRPWGPGEVGIFIAADRHESKSDGTVEDIPEGATVNTVSITLPESAAKFAPDAHGVAAAVGALVTMAKDPALLKEAPEKAIERLPMLGERFTLHRFSIGLGEEQRLGFSLRPKRTELSAAELAKGLGLKAPHHEAIHITDVNPNRLADGEATEIPWHGLSLEIELDESSDGGVGLAGWIVDDIEVLPAAGD
jgi:hypothetical protein